MIKMRDLLKEMQTVEWDKTISLSDVKVALQDEPTISWNSKLKKLFDRHGNEMVPVDFKGKIRFTRKYPIQF